MLSLAFAMVLEEVAGVGGKRGGKREGGGGMCGENMESQVFSQHSCLVLH